MKTLINTERLKKSYVKYVFNFFNKYSYSKELNKIKNDIIETFYEPKNWRFIYHLVESRYGSYINLYLQKKKEGLIFEFLPNTIKVNLAPYLILTFSDYKKYDKIKKIIIELGVKKLDSKAVKMIKQYLKDKITFDKLKRYLVISFL